MHTSKKGVQFIEEFEGFVGHPYRDAVGVWTIGYGHTAGVGPHHPTITKQEASLLLAHDLAHAYEPLVTHAAHHYGLTLNQHEFDALVSFCYNLGGGFFVEGHTMGDAMRSKNKTRIAAAFLVYDIAGGHVLAGLRRRREAERKVFLHSW